MREVLDGELPEEMLNFVAELLNKEPLEAKAEILRLWFGALTRPALPAIPPNVEELESGVR